jgi:hypothetical protein
LNLRPWTPASGIPVYGNRGLATRQKTAGTQRATREFDLRVMSPRRPDPLTWGNPCNACPDWLFASQRFALFPLPSHPLAVWTRYGDVPTCRTPWQSHCTKKVPSRTGDVTEPPSTGCHTPVIPLCISRLSLAKQKAESPLRYQHPPTQPEARDLTSASCLVGRRTTDSKDLSSLGHGQ